MIYLTADPHGGEAPAGVRRYAEMAAKDDLLIILGDVGLNFQDTDENRRFTEWFLSIDKPIAIVDGNHENHAFLNGFPADTWCGGPVHRLSDSIVHLKRGNIYTIGGKTFFVMGGCKSSAKWKEMGLWYEGEEPSEREVASAYENLRKCRHKVDYVLTHKYAVYEGDYAPLTLEGLTRFMDAEVEYDHWYAGHKHIAQSVDDRHTLVYDALVEVP